MYLGKGLYLTLLPGMGFIGKQTKPHSYNFNCLFFFLQTRLFTECVEELSADSCLAEI